MKLYVDDNIRALRKRILKSNILSYSGPPLQIKNLFDAEVLKVMISLEQFIDSEEDASKQNYPNENYETYKDCDEEYVYKN